MTPALRYGIQEGYPRKRRGAYVGSLGGPIALEMVPFEYRDLLVSLWSDETPGLFRARAEEDFGRSTPPVRIYVPFDDRWFVQYQDRLGSLTSRQLHYVGARLFDSLFQGEILRLYVHLLEQIRITEARLRVRLSIEPASVAALPWECLYDTRTGEYLSSSKHVTLVRYHTPRRREPAAVPAHPPLRVLLVADGPDRSAGERLSSEARIVRHALAPLEESRRVDVHEVGSAFDGDSDGDRHRMDSLSDILRSRFDIVHLFCDARRDSTSTRFLLGNQAMRLDAFAKAVAEANPCLVLWSGGASAADVGPELARSLLDEVPALLVHRGANPKELLGAHSASFYSQVAELKPADEALAVARNAVLSHVGGEAEWIPPALYSSRKDASILFNPARSGVGDVYQISEGRYRRGLRESLNRFWPKPERYFAQRIQWTPRGAPLSSFALDGEFLSQPQSVDELSMRFQQLLLLGEGGSGKTMALFRLFYEHAQPILAYERKSPLPVYASLPDMGEGSDLFELLGAGLDPELFRSDLEEGRFLFLLDSLDGLSASGAAKRVRALNRFVRRFPLNRFVIASRRPAAASVDVPSWAEIVPFAEWEAIDYLIANETIRPEAARTLYRQLVTDLGGQRASNPQVLAMARRLWREGASVPRSVTEIFSAFFRLAGSSIAPDTRDGLLPQLAVFMSRGDRLSLTREYLEERTETKGLEALARELAARSAGVRSASALLAEVEKTRLLRGPRAFTFPNISFQEFLTAYALRGAALNTILALIPPADYRDPEGESDQGRPINLSLGPFHGAMPFLCGLREDGGELVRALCERDVVLAASCFREVRGVRKKLHVIHDAIATAFDSEDSMQARVAVLALESLADPKAVSMLERVAARAGSSGRAVALEALGRLRSYRSVAVLETAIRDSDPAVAKAAQDALTRIQAS